MGYENFNETDVLTKIQDGVYYHNMDSPESKSK